MRIITVNLPDSYIKELLKSSICTGTNRPEHLRLAIRDQIVNEAKLAKKTEKKIEEKKIT